MNQSVCIALSWILLVSVAWPQEPSAWKRRNAQKKRAGTSQPISGAGVSATFTNVRYGPDERNLLDIWLAKSSKPTPLVVYIHGGGFLHNDKSKAYGMKEIDRFLAAGVSFATISYRYRTNPEGILGSLKDSKRALQFLRSKSGEYHLDKSRFGAYGSSAGAGTSLWLAFHDDMADPADPDPVLRESTRLSVAGAFATQSTYDLSQWPVILNDPEAGRWPRKKQDKQLDILAWMSPDDPPFYARNDMPNAPVDLDHPNMNLVHHHPLHIKALKARVEETGLKGAYLHAPALTILPAAEVRTDFVSFMVNHLVSAEKMK
jgi:hypothetical protein